jgi:hypothetical protein
MELGQEDVSQAEQNKRRKSQKLWRWLLHQEPEEVTSNLPNRTAGGNK